MAKVSIIYWSGTGNTEKMALEIENGAKSKGYDVLLKDVNDANIEDAINCDVLLLGCSAMGSEELEQDEFQPFFDNIKDQLSGKKVGIFGSYSWGDGEWLRTWQEELESLGSILVDEGLMVNSYPSDDDLKLCFDFGANI